jgi:predicted nuclease of predicted toxin-antitoxin system
VRILFDQGAPVPLRESLGDHEVSTAYERGWSTLKNSDLLDSAEREGFEVLLTTDKNLRHQQNLRARSIAIVVLRTTSWPLIQREIPAVVRAITSAMPGSYVEVRFSIIG